MDAPDETLMEPMFIAVHPDDLMRPEPGAHPAKICHECKCLTENWHQVIIREEMTVTMMVLGFSPTTQLVVKCLDCIRKSDMD